MRLEQPKQQPAPPARRRFEVLSGFGAAAGAPLGRGRPGGTSLVSPARGCPLSSPEASEGLGAAAELCSTARGRGSHSRGSRDGR